jgi:uncharacterized membrane protein HdeD (DUF308 family)
LGSGNKVVGVLLIVAGVLAIFLPMVAGVAITAIVGWLVVLAGAAHLYFGWHARTTGAVVWQLVISLLYFVVGVYMILHPARGLLTLTLLLAIYFVIEGVMELATYFTLRRAHVANGFLWNGLITLVLGVLIWAQWPFSSVWALGTIIGISLVMSGIARLSFRAGRLAL